MIILIIVTILVASTVTWGRTPVGHRHEPTFTYVTVTLFVTFLLLSVLVATGVLD